MGEDDYHIVVQVWIRNRTGQWLISRRSPTKTYPLCWEATAGSVLAGEDSVSGAVREVREELGVILDPACGKLFTSYRKDKTLWRTPGFLDVWVFTNDTPIENIVLQETETCDAMWADEDTILQMQEDGRFVPMSQNPYCHDLFAAYRR